MLSTVKTLTVGAIVVCAIWSSLGETTKGRGALLKQSTPARSEHTRQPASAEILKIDKEIINGTVETYGVWRFSRYLLIKVRACERAIWLGPELSLCTRPGRRSYWDADFSRLSGMMEEDILDGTVITGRVNRYYINYDVPLQKVVYRHFEYSEETESEKLLDEETLYCSGKIVSTASSSGSGLELPGKDMVEGAPGTGEIQSCVTQAR